MRSWGAIPFILIAACGSHTPRSETHFTLPVSAPLDSSFLGYVNENKYTWMSETYLDTNSVRKRIQVPPGTKRVVCESGSFGDWLRHLPLFPGHPAVLLFDGREKWNQLAHAAVINIDVGKFDLQQCADAVIRLRAEYLYSRGMYSDIHFNYTSGHTITFSDWMAGKRPVVKGGKVTFTSGHPKGSDRANFTAYLQNIFTYAGSLSLNKELRPANVREVLPGDVLIVGGSPGHAVLVLDVAEGPGDERYFMIAQSYMPAQQIHLLKNPNREDISPWYSVKESGTQIETPEWTFSTDQLKKF
ncbi:MAG: DUF4846 domain-containing protein [Bacteroidia bacterium]|nr:DUF4846 domain-containing protein [Bacteroidia bacterium]